MHTHWPNRWNIGVALGFLACFFLGCTQPSSSGKPKVVATIFCYFDALRAIGGDKIQPVILLTPNTSPHEFSASMKDREAVDEARLVIKNGMGIDDWVDRLASSSRATILDISKDADVLNTPETPLDSATGAPSKPPVNPHIWLDPLVQINAANRIRDALIAMAPADKATFDTNAAAYIADIQKLHEDFKTACAAFPKKDFVGFHSAYAYLARRYGLRQIAAIEEVPEAGLSRAQIDRVIALIKDQHVPVLFTEDAFPAAAAEQIIQATGVQRGVLQPLETYNDINDTYVSLMRKNLEELKRTLGK